MFAVKHAALHEKDNTVAVKWFGKGFLALALVALLAGNLMVGARLYSGEAGTDDREAAYDNIALFTKVIEQIRQNYVDLDKTEYKNLVYGALRGMLQSLDPHSQFMDPDMYTDMKDDTSGHFGGLGIVISIRDGILTIVAPMEDTPGFKAGLLSGDKIIEIDGESTEGLSLTEAVKQLRGIPGTDVTIRILRPQPHEIKEVTITRAVINVPSVKDAKIIEDGIGYLRITQFNVPTAGALQEALNELLDQGMESLIIDLRNNPGGLLNAAIEVSQKFLKRGDLVVFTRGREEETKQKYVSRGRYHYLDFPIVILVNGGSASASEIVSGALQDHKRAILVGERTFGKGSVQSVLPQDDGSAIRLTTAKYYTPSERVIHERGIEPDIVVSMSPEEWRTLMIQRAKPENSTLTAEEEEKEVVDVQLERALDVLKGVMIFQAHNASSSSETFARHKD
ncbi:MAG: S41 family peptidase [Verrucomicrobia bacterium]|nr:S41 family peptidase [Verrucomicrobiota bacterium]